MTDEEIIMKHDRACRPRARMEVKIVNAVLDEAKKKGYLMSVEDGEQEDLEPTHDPVKVKELLFNLDDAHLCLYENKKAHRPLGRILFVFGNDGWDVISDYHMALEEFLKPVNELANKLADGMA